MPIPSKPELIYLRDVLTKHALGVGAVHQCRVLEYLFSRVIEERERCKSITPLEIANLPRSPKEKEPDHPKEAAHGAIRDIRNKLEAFYADGESSHKPPHPESQRLKHPYRVDVMGEGNYLLTFQPYRAKQQKPDLVPLFWAPHLPPQGGARILYPEPFFMIDEQKTFFRNAGMGTQPDVSALSYLNIPGPLKTGYSYVPSGIVHALLMLTKTLRHCDNQSPDLPAYEAVKPHVSIPPGDEDLILLGTPSSTDLVGTIQDGQKMMVNTVGVTFEDRAHNDDEHTQWGVVTRTRQNHRVVTMLAAKHGRSVEAMARFVTRHEQLALLAKEMGRSGDLPESFQVMFRMPVVSTPREGPSVGGAVIEAASF